MKKNLTALIAITLLLSACGSQSSSSESSISEQSSISSSVTSVEESSEEQSSQEESLSPQEESSEEQSSSEDSSSVASSQEESSSEESSSSEQSSSIEESSSSEQSSSEQSSSESSYIEESSSEEFERILLDCDYYQMDLPKNKDNPYELTTTLSQDSSTWSNNDLYSELPEDFRFIYGNSCDDGAPGHKASPSFYGNDAGGLRFDQKTKGFQTQLFEHTGAKLEIRIGISQVNNASGKPEEGIETLGIYYFNNKGNLLGKHEVEEETITTKTKEIKYYETSDYTSDIAYFEVRLNAMAYKGSQVYNVGIGYCNFKSWERI